MDGGSQVLVRIVDVLTRGQGAARTFLLAAIVFGSTKLYGQDSSTTRETAPRDESAVSVNVEGIVTALKRVYVPARIDGVVESVQVTVGQRVEPGELLVQLESRKAEIGLREAELVMSTADQRRIAAEAAVAQSRIDLQIAEDELQRAIQSRDRVADSISDAELQRRELSVARARSQVELQQATLLAESAQRELSEVRVQAQRDDLADHQLLSPFGGTIAKVAVAQGQWCTAGAPVIEVLDTERVGILCFVPTQLAAVDVSELEFELWSDSEQIEGMVSIDFRSPEIDPVRQVVELRLVVAESSLLVGQRIQIKVKHVSSQRDEQ